MEGRPLSRRRWYEYSEPEALREGICHLRLPRNVLLDVLASPRSLCYFPLHVRVMIAGNQARLPHVTEVQLVELKNWAQEGFFNLSSMSLGVLLSLGNENEVLALFEGLQGYAVMEKFYRIFFWFVRLSDLGSWQEQGVAQLRNLFPPHLASVWSEIHSRRTKNLSCLEQSIQGSIMAQNWCKAEVRGANRRFRENYDELGPVADFVRRESLVWFDSIRDFHLDCSLTHIVTNGDCCQHVWQGLFTYQEKAFFLFFGDGLFDENVLRVMEGPRNWEAILNVLNTQRLKWEEELARRELVEREEERFAFEAWCAKKAEPLTLPQERAEEISLAYTAPLTQDWLWLLLGCRGRLVENVLQPLQPLGRNPGPHMDLRGSRRRRGRNPKRQRLQAQN